ncbi:MAG: 16S rRNA (guanine(527)-N(7))-methyltransferase RsmG [Pseudomonadota bacterium]
MILDEDGFGPDNIRKQIDVSRETFDRLEIVLRVLNQWRQQKNLIGPSEWSHIWRRHIWDSLQILPLLPNDPSILDLGSGGGFPALPLACALPPNSSSHVTMVETVGRKCNFLREAISEADLQATVHQGRAEHFNLEGVTAVTARAFAPLPKLIGLAAPWLLSGAVGVFHKGESWQEELTAASETWTFAYQVNPSQSGGKGVILKISEISDG